MKGASQRLEGPRERETARMNKGEEERKGKGNASAHAAVTAQALGELLRRMEKELVDDQNDDLVPGLTITLDRTLEQIRRAQAQMGDLVALCEMVTAQRRLATLLRETKERHAQREKEDE